MASYLSHSGLYIANHYARDCKIGKRIAWMNRLWTGCLQSPQDQETFNHAGDCDDFFDRVLHSAYLTKKPMSLLATRMPPEQTSKLHRKMESRACATSHTGLTASSAMNAANFDLILVWPVAYSQWLFHAYFDSYAKRCLSLSRRSKQESYRISEGKSEILNTSAETCAQA